MAWREPAPERGRMAGETSGGPPYDRPWTAWGAGWRTRSTGCWRMATTGASPGRSRNLPPAQRRSRRVHGAGWTPSPAGAVLRQALTRRLPRVQPLRPQNRMGGRMMPPSPCRAGSGGRHRSGGADPGRTSLHPRSHRLRRHRLPFHPLRPHQAQAAGLCPAPAVAAADLTWLGRDLIRCLLEP
jgi:hypothetical protein